MATFSFRFTSFVLTFITLVLALMSVRAEDSKTLLLSDQTTPTPTCTTILLSFFETGGPTMTVYEATVTRTAEVDCGGCSLAIVNPLGIGPVVFFNATVTIPETYTVDKPICSPTLAQIASNTYGTIAKSCLPSCRSQLAVRSPTCTTTLTKATPFTFGPTKTVWIETATYTSSVPCGGCSLVVQNPFDLGPQIFFTTTVTVMETRTLDAVVCESSRSIPEGPFPSEPYLPGGVL